MQRKTLLSACIALALSGQGWAADITEIETTTGEKKNTNVTCPADPGKLSPEELKRLPSECSSVVEQNLMPWLVTGAATALITTLAIVELNDDDDHHRNNSPLPPTPPDDDSDDTPVPPTPGGDEIIPDDGPDDTPTPPKPIAFNNDVILDKTEKTLTIRDSVFSYTENADGTISLQDSNGRKATINLWQIDETNNTVALEGMSADGATKWQYNHNGELIITGDNTTVNNTGKTIVDGKGATGTEIAGNNAVVNQDGELDVSGGGHGIDITGDSATVDNKGGMTVADADSIGIQIDGDKAVVSNDGDNAISNGGTGTSITGNEATANNTGKTTVDGQGSTGTEIAGNNATVTQEGELTFSSGGRGIDITGNNAKVDTKGKMTITGTDSVGVSINGDSATLTNTGDIDVSNSATGFSLVTNEGIISLAGSMKVGDFSTGMALSGDNNSVTLAAKDINVTGQKATGVNISGESNTVDITGNILVDKDQTADNAVDYFYDPSVGVNISGNSNTVSLDGKLTVIADSELTSRKYMAFDGSQENISGLTVSGDGNTVNLNGGIQFVGEKNALADGSTIAANRSYFGNTPLVSVDGQSKVYLNGDSTISGSLPLGYANILQLSNKAALEIGSDATFSMQDISVYEHYFAQTPQIIKVDTGSQVVNNGDVDIWNISFAGIWGENSTGINNGNITLSQYDYSSPETPFSEPDHMAFLSSSGGSAVNNGTITAKVMEQHSVLDMGAAAGVADPRVFNNSVSSMMGMEAYGKGTVLNSENGVIDMYGRGNIGMLAIDNSVANNAGKITLDTLWVDQNDTTTLRTDLHSNTAIDYGVGMATGTNSGGGARSNGVATNQQGGVITVYNAGAAMAAYGASNMVINQGIINLEKNGNYDGGLGANMLVGMAIAKAPLSTIKQA